MATPTPYELDQVVKAAATWQTFLPVLNLRQSAFYSKLFAYNFRGMLLELQWHMCIDISSHVTAIPYPLGFKEFTRTDRKLCQNLPMLSW